MMIMGNHDSQEDYSDNNLDAADAAYNAAVETFTTNDKLFKKALEQANEARSRYDTVKEAKEYINLLAIAENDLVESLDACGKLVKAGEDWYEMAIHKVGDVDEVSILEKEEEIYGNIEKALLIEKVADKYLVESKEQAEIAQVFIDDQNKYLDEMLVEMEKHAHTGGAARRFRN